MFGTITYTSLETCIYMYMCSCKPKKHTMISGCLAHLAGKRTSFVKCIYTCTCTYLFSATFYQAHTNGGVQILLKVWWPRILSFTRVESLLVALAISLVIFNCFHNLQYIVASVVLIIIGCGHNNSSTYKHVYL